MNEAIEALKRQLKIDIQRNCTDPGSTHYESCPCSQLRALAELETERDRLRARVEELEAALAGAEELERLAEIGLQRCMERYSA